MLLGGFLVNWRTGEGCVCASDLLRLPDEILEEVALVLGEK